MALLIHVLVAAASLGFTTYLFFQPSKKKFYVAYSLVGLTLASGSYLVITGPAHMLQACVTGLVYLSVVGLGMVLAHQKMAGQKTL